jgi:hypothetical protein
VHLFYDFEAQKKRKAQPDEEAVSAAACAIGFYVSPNAKKRISTRIWGLFARSSLTGVQTTLI